MSVRTHSRLSSIILNFIFSIHCVQNLDQCRVDFTFSMHCFAFRPIPACKSRHFSKWIERSLNYQSDKTSLTIVVSVSLDHEGLYFNLRTIFEARGKVRFMFVHKVFGLAAKSPSSIITFFFCRISQKTGKHRRL